MKKILISWIAFLCLHANAQNGQSKVIDALTKESVNELQIINQSKKQIINPISPLLLRTFI